LPHENTIYFGDLKNLPYGNKSKDELIYLAKNILDFFQTKNVKAVVIACNTSSALAYDSIKNCYNFPIYPIIQSCAEVIAKSNYKKLGVFATEGTVKSGAYAKEIKKHNPNTDIKEIACPNWVPIVERRYPEADKLPDIKSKLNQMIEFNPDKIILGCTHYPYLLKDLTLLAPKELFIDPAIIFVEYLKNKLILNSNNKIGDELFYVSDYPQEFLQNSQLFYKINKLPIIAK
jgi:glutamate racemase